MVDGVLAEIPYRGDRRERCKALAEATHVLGRAAGLELFAEVQGTAGDRAGLLDLSGAKVPLRQDHGHEEVAADRRSCPIEGALSVRDGIGGPAKVVEAM